MDLDLETFLTVVYVLTDDLYKRHVAPVMPHCGGAEPKLSDSEVLCLALVSQWRAGVPWQSERGFVRYALRHLRPLFPAMTSQSAFNRRLRRLWGAYILIQQALARELSQATDCEVMDCVPIAVAKGARSFHPGHIPDIARVGKGGNDRFFYGLHLLLVVSASGPATGWVLASGNIQDRWLAEVLLSTRAGATEPSGPLNGDGSPRLKPPSDWIGPLPSCGEAQGKLILADLGYSGAAWQRHWQDDYQATVMTPPDRERHAARLWHSSTRQVVETAFATLCAALGLQAVQAHTLWGMITRIGAKLAAYNLGILINRLTGRPDLALPTLVG
jgi:transposase